MRCISCLIDLQRGADPTASIARNVVEAHYGVELVMMTLDELIDDNEAMNFLNGLSLIQGGFAMDIQILKPKKEEVLDNSKLFQ